MHHSLSSSVQHDDRRRIVSRRLLSRPYRQRPNIAAPPGVGVAHAPFCSDRGCGGMSAWEPSVSDVANANIARANVALDPLFVDHPTASSPMSAALIAGAGPTIAALQRRVDSAEKALKFYADPANWIDTPPWDGDPNCVSPKAVPVTKEDGRPCDCGDTARAALASVLGGTL